MARITLVTGANKGIGFSVAKILCQLKSKEDIVYLTARDESRGMKAVAELKALGCDAAFHQLDLDSLESIKKLSNYLKQTYGGLDVLVNNAGVAYKGSSTAPFDEQAEVTNRTNYFGTLNVCKHLVPLIKDGGRVVHVSSQSGHSAFSKMQPSLQNQFNAPDLTEEQLTLLINSFIDATKEGNHSQKGWPSSAYGVSKAGVTALCALQQRDYDHQYPGNDVIFSACCPGYCDTDMTSHKGSRPADVGADVAVYLATLPLGSDAPRGTFWYDKKVLPWKC